MNLFLRTIAALWIIFGLYANVFFYSHARSIGRKAYGYPLTVVIIRRGNVGPIEWQGVAANTLIWILPAGFMWFQPGRVKRIRNERLRNGRCAHCGYSLTGTVARNCPECGTDNTKTNHDNGTTNTVE